MSETEKPESQTTEVSDAFFFETTKLPQKPVLIENSWYLLEGADVEAAIIYRKGQVAGATLNEDGSATMSGAVVTTEPLLVANCLYTASLKPEAIGKPKEKVTADDLVKGELVPQTTISKWPHLIIARCFNWIKANSDLDPKVEKGKDGKKQIAADPTQTPLGQQRS